MSAILNILSLSLANTYIPIRLFSISQPTYFFSLCWLYFVVTNLVSDQAKYGAIFTGKLL